MWFCRFSHLIFWSVTDPKVDRVGLVSLMTLFKFFASWIDLLIFLFTFNFSILLWIIEQFRQMCRVLDTHNLFHLLGSILVQIFILLDMWSLSPIFLVYEILCFIKFVLWIYNSSSRKLCLAICNCCWRGVNNLLLSLGPRYYLVPSRFFLVFHVENMGKWFRSSMGGLLGLFWFLVIKLVLFHLSLVKVTLMEIKRSSRCMWGSWVASLLWLTSITMIGVGLPAWLCSRLYSWLISAWQSRPWFFRHHFLQQTHFRCTVLVLWSMLFISRLWNHWLVMSKFY